MQKLNTVWYHLISSKLLLQHVNNPKPIASRRELSTVPGTHSTATDGKSGITVHEAIETAMKFTEELW